MRLILLICLFAIGCQIWPKAPIESVISINKLYHLKDDSLQNLCPYNSNFKLHFTNTGIQFSGQLENSNIQAHFVKRDTTIFLEHCIELFLDPDGDGINYYELELNARGAIFDKVFKTNTHPFNRPENMIEWNIDKSFISIDIDGTLNDESDVDTTWAFEVFIPYDALIMDKAPSKGDVWRYNIMRIDLEDGKSLFWTAKPTGKNHIHYPELWETIKF